MRKAGMVVFILLIVVGGFALAKNVIAQMAVTKAVRAISGLGVEMKGMEVGVLAPVVSMRGLKILNPQGFSDRVMADFPELTIRYDLADFLKGKVHLPEMRVHLNELIVEKNQANEVNIKSLQSFVPKGGGDQPPPKVQIDLLGLKIAKVIFKDHTLGKQNVREFNVNIDDTFKDITDPRAVANLILVKALSKTTIPSLAGVDLGGLKAEISQAVAQQVQGIVGSVQERATEALMQTQGQVEKLF